MSTEKIGYTESPVRVIQGDALEVLKTLPDDSVDCCVTSPPYWGLRDYHVEWQLGLEPSPQEYVVTLVGIFEEVRRVLQPAGTLWLNLGDCYAHGNPPGRRDTVRGLSSAEIASVTGAGQWNSRRGSLKPKDLVGLPWRVAFALQDAGWWLRSDIIWAKPNPKPESVTDRPTRAHEYLFLLAKSERYYYDADAIKEPAIHSGRVRVVRYDGSQKMCAAGDAVNDRLTTIGANGERSIVVGGERNKRDVWSIATRPYSETHFATFPEALVEPCVLAGCPVGGVVLDPFAGSGTTLAVALRLGRRGVGIELNPEYIPLIEKRLASVTLPLPLDVEEAPA